jgi:hypothetical protein
MLGCWSNFLWIKMANTSYPFDDCQDQALVPTWGQALDAYESDETIYESDETVFVGDVGELAPLLPQFAISPPVPRENIKTLLSDEAKQEIALEYLRNRDKDRRFLSRSILGIFAAVVIFPGVVAGIGVFYPDAQVDTLLENWMTPVLMTMSGLVGASIRDYFEGNEKGKI